MYGFLNSTAHYFYNKVSEFSPAVSFVSVQWVWS